MDEVLQYADLDYFFYYGENTLESECKYDLWTLLLQPKNSLLYDRQESAEIDEYENYPNAVFLQILLRFAIANAIAYRNSLVTDGSEGSKDRRIFTSQNSIGFQQREGELDIQVFYFLSTSYNEILDQNMTFAMR